MKELEIPLNNEKNKIESKINDEIKSEKQILDEQILHSKTNVSFKININ